MTAKFQKLIREGVIEGNSVQICLYALLECIKIKALESYPLCMWGVLSHADGQWENKLVTYYCQEDIDSDSLIYQRDFSITKEKMEIFPKFPHSLISWNSHNLRDLQDMMNDWFEVNYEITSINSYDMVTLNVSN